VIEKENTSWSLPDAIATRDGVWYQAACRNPGQGAPSADDTS
jgi:hypothetical protein